MTAPIISSQRHLPWCSGLGVERGVRWFFTQTLANMLEGGAVVAVAVLHADVGEHAGHGLGADVAVDRGDRAVAPVGASAPSPARRRREQPRARQLLDADGQAVVALAGLHRHRRDAQGGGAGGAGVGDVVDGDAGLADLLLELLAACRPRAHEVARGEHAHVLHLDATVGERAERRLGREVDHVEVGVLAELGHVDPKDPECHLKKTWSTSQRLEAEADGLGAVPRRGRPTGWPASPSCPAARARDRDRR